MNDETMTILIDGQCPLCKREGQLLRWLDAGRNRIQIQDITDPQFRAGRVGADFKRLNSQIHAVLPDGRLVKGMDVFRRAYAAVGLGWLLAPTAWPGIKPLVDTGYAWFARNRHRLTGRCTSRQCQPTSAK